jgi:AcrR family transcriptional regulator
MPVSPTLDRLLAAAVSHALTAGIADLSLRELASAIGTSHRMLIYHFGSREGLLVAVTQAVEEQERAALLDLHSALTPDDARRAWQRLSDPGLWPQERLFFELYSYALLGRPGTEGFLGGVIEPWITPVAAALVRAGEDEQTARADARLGLAVVRGLLLDLLATGDRAGADAAFERFLQIGSAAAQGMDAVPGQPAGAAHRRGPAHGSPGTPLPSGPERPA